MLVHVRLRSFHVTFKPNRLVKKEQSFSQRMQTIIRNNHVLLGERLINKRFSSEFAV